MPAMLQRQAKRAVIWWVAILAILMAALAPSISHAIGLTMPPSWAEICSTAGKRLVPVDGDFTPKSHPPGAMNHLEHCPYCSLHLDAVALPPVAPQVALPLVLAHQVPEAFLHADRTLSVWASAQARAPPILH
jgi:hypothetical protein